MATPMLSQYREIKEKYRDAILLYRLGDFYEMFGTDAREGSRILGLTLTQRQGMPMCGVPHHAAQTYIGRLLKAGRKVALCEQTGVADGKTLTPREVVEVLSPGTVYDQDFLDSGNNNYLMAIGVAHGFCSIGWVDASTGEMTFAAFPATESQQVESAISREIARRAPREILVQESLLEEQRVLHGQSGLVINRIPDWVFDRERGEQRLREVLQVASLQGFGFHRDDPALLTASVLLEYLEENAHRVVGHLHGVTRFHDEDVVALDEATLRNLEILRNMHEGTVDFSLLEVLDETQTPMGARLLRRRLVAPVRKSAEISQRLDQVATLYHNQSLLQDLRRTLPDCHDLERLSGRLGVEKAHPRDLWSIAATIHAAIKIRSILPPNGVVGIFGAELIPWDALTALRDTIWSTLQDEPPVSVDQGGVIRNGFDEDLDSLRSLHTNSQAVLEAYLQEQREETGIQTLKVRYNRMLGHFFEVPRSQERNVPEYYIRRQSLAQADRFTTPRLSQLEIEINNAGAGSIAREQELFTALRQHVTQHIRELILLAAELGRLDVAATLAGVATRRGYRRPEITEDAYISIREGRHPVVEAHLPAGSFVTNDITVGKDVPPFALITGPNMAGKSTVLRQTALIVLMTQIGSFVPATEAVIGIADRIYCRVGASDNISRGESTFLVEMNETSNILRNATSHSLVIMDEVGRGTSTQDGLAIARAVCEYLLDTVASRTLFATHYHELTTMDDQRCQFLTMQVLHENDTIHFMKKLVTGKADRSYGVDVARMAGLPERVIQRARYLIEHPEELIDAPESADPQQEPSAVSPAPAAAVVAEPQLFAVEELVLQEIRNVNPDDLTPRSAIDLLYRWKDELL